MSFCVVIVVHSFILNEVLSLNAQECVPLNFHQYLFVLNEVLSLNAQESGYPSRRGERNTLLNEVLSLNAQECPCGRTASIP